MTMPDMAQRMKKKAMITPGQRCHFRKNFSQRLPHFKSFGLMDIFI
jgi:hypothetical protein